MLVIFHRHKYTTACWEHVIDFSSISPDVAGCCCIWMLLATQNRWHCLNEIMFAITCHTLPINFLKWFFLYAYTNQKNGRLAALTQALQGMPSQLAFSLEPKLVCVFRSMGLLAGAFEDNSKITCDICFIMSNRIPLKTVLIKAQQIKASKNSLLHVS